MKFLRMYSKWCELRNHIQSKISWVMLQEAICKTELNHDEATNYSVAKKHLNDVLEKMEELEG